MTYTTEQIAFMAKLVPEHAQESPDLPGRYESCDDDGYWRDWQPWADTEAGRSDALALLAAVMRWAADNDAWSGNSVTVEQADKVRDVYDALASGDLAAIQRATCEAAEAIGSVM